MSRLCLVDACPDHRDLKHNPEFHLLANAKVSEFDMAFFGEHHVVRLYISVHNALVCRRMNNVNGL